VTVANQSRALAARARPAAIALSGSQRLVIFAAFLGIIGTALWLGPLRDVHRISTVASLPWWVFAVACYVSSLLYVEVRLHRELTTLSLTEIPVAMGLFLVDPRVLLGCYAGGVLLAGWTRRRFRPAKDFSNLMLDVLKAASTGPTRCARSLFKWWPRPPTRAWASSACCSSSTARCSCLR
jgi:hypothetical protein